MTLGKIPEDHQWSTGSSCAQGSLEERPKCQEARQEAATGASRVTSNADVGRKGKSRKPRKAQVEG